MTQGWSLRLDACPWKATMPHIHFHDLPVYRLTEAKYDTELRELTHHMVPDVPGPWLPSTDEMISRHRANALADLERHFGNWRFNEVVGYVRLSMLNRHVCGAYYRRHVRETGPRYDKPVAREIRTRTKVFRSASQFAEPQRIPPGSTNAQCLGIINEYVSAGRKALPRRYFDQQWLRDIGPYVDWCAMVEASDR